MIMMMSALSRVGKDRLQFPDLTAEYTDLLVLMQEGKEWRVVATANGRRDPTWLNPDWLSFNPKHGKKSTLRLLERWSGIVVGSTDEKDQQDLLVRSDDEIRRFYDIYDALCIASVKLEFVKLTKDRFSRYLTTANRTRNRDIRDCRVGYLSNELKKLRWWPSDSAIVIDVLNNLANGNHRLVMEEQTGWLGGTAILATGYPVVAAMAFDSGLGRGVKDNLHFRCGVELNRTFVGALNFSVEWMWRPEGQKPKAVSAPEAVSVFWDEEAAYLHMRSVKGRRLSSPVVAAFGNISTRTGDPRVMQMFDQYMDKSFNAPVGSAVWALVQTLPNLHVLTNGDKKDGLKLQQHRYHATATAIFSMLEGDRKRWTCQELLNNHHQTRESISLSILRHSVDGVGRVPNVLVDLPDLPKASATSGRSKFVVEK